MRLTQEQYSQYQMYVQSYSFDVILLNALIHIYWTDIDLVMLFIVQIHLSQMEVGWKVLLQS